MLRRPDRKGPLHVALAFPLAQAPMQSLAQGIMAYAKKAAPWTLNTAGETGILSIEQLDGWEGEGVIAALTRPSEVQAAQHLMERGVPVVAIGGVIGGAPIPRVTPADQDIGRMGADHLFQCGFRRFGFYGLKQVAYSRQREAGFAARLKALGFSYAARCAPSTYDGRPWQDDAEAVRRWLQGLTPPVGILAANDFRARLLIEACDRARLKVPTQIGVVGVDNDRVLCELGRPGLSSIDCDWQRVGQEAARTLHRIMQGETPEAELRIAPRGIVRRSSTASRVTGDPRLDKALAYIHDHPEEAFGVEQLAEASDVSRRTLEQVFRAKLRATPYAYLCRTRINRAKMLLQFGSLAKLTRISRLCGFRDSRRFRLVFQRLEGFTPATFRTLYGPDSA